MTFIPSKKVMRPHRKLVVWQESIHLVKSIYLLTASLPEEEKFGIVSQMRKAAVSIPINIAEGAARQSDKEFVRFLYFSEGSLSELDALLEICEALDFFSAEKLIPYFKTFDKISALLTGLRKSIERRQ